MLSLLDNGARLMSTSAYCSVKNQVTRSEDRPELSDTCRHTFVLSVALHVHPCNSSGLMLERVISNFGRGPSSHNSDNLLWRQTLSSPARGLRSLACVTKIIKESGGYVIRYGQVDWMD